MARLTSAERKRQNNRYKLKSCRTAIKKLVKVKDSQEALTQYKQVSSMLDKLAKCRIMHKNRSASTKSRLAKYVKGLAPASATS